MSKIFRQADSRWGSLPYPKKPYTVASSGCGLCAVTMCLVEEPEYSDYTPKTVRPYMVQFATMGHGTTWSGIKKSLEHYGYTVKDPDISRTMNGAWNILNGTSLKRGVLLFRAGTKGGVRWTNGGHYVMFKNYFVKNGKHYFVTQDSSGRHNDGTFCYEDHMAGLLPKIWICTGFHGNYPRLKNTKGYTGVIPSPTLRRGTTEKTKTKQWQLFLNWTFGEKVIKTPKGNFKSKTELYTKYFQKNCGLVADGIVGPKTIKKAREMK